MNTLIKNKRRNSISKNRNKEVKTVKTFSELTNFEKERTAYILVEKHFKKHDSIQKTTELWKEIFDLMKDQIYILKGAFWYPHNLSEILNFK
jgi:uncharacterized protein YjcR